MYQNNTEDTQHLLHLADFLGTDILDEIHNFSGHLIPVTRVSDHRLVETEDMGPMTDVEKILFTLNQRSYYARKTILESITGVHPDTIPKGDYGRFNEVVMERGAVSDFLQMEMLRRKGQMTNTLMWSSIQNRVQPHANEKMMPHIALVPDFQIMIGRKIGEAISLHFSEKGHKNLKIVVLEC